MADFVGMTIGCHQVFVWVDERIQTTVWPGQVTCLGRHGSLNGTELHDIAI